MKKILLACLGLLISIPSFSQLNSTELGNLPYTEELSDVWGYVDELGNEYALVGVNNAFSVVDVSDPTNPVEVFSEEGPSSIWRDIKVWGDHAYVTNETGEGLYILDLSPLPQSNALTSSNFTSGGWESAHNLYIDENGVCYIFGADRGNGGVIMYDLTQDPNNPVEIGTVDTWYVHDGMARGDTLYLGHINDGFLSVVDIADKASPVVMGTHNTSFNFTHNLWVSDDGNFVYTTDEKSNAYIGAYDISDPTNIQEVDLFQSSPGEGVIPHNAHFLNNYVITSYYTDGLSVLDVTYPYNMVDVANYDTSVDYEGDGFNGAWGAYPYLPSGNVLVTDIETGLYIVSVDYIRGCYLEGDITDFDSGLVLSGVTITCTSSELNNQTGISGFYASGIAIAGSYDITYSKAGYESQTIPVTLVNGELVIQDVELQIMSNFSFNGSVQNASDQSGIENAQVLVYNDDFTFEVETNNQGQFQIPVFFEGDYTIIASQWGYVTECMDITGVDSNTEPIEIDLSIGYYDDFSTDLGWTIDADAETGNWLRDIPIGTFNGSGLSNPDADINDDCSGFAMVTGNQEGGVGDADVDNGITKITSPIMDLTTFSDPYLNYYRWYYTYSWGAGPDDSLLVYIQNSTDTVLIDVVDISNMNPGQWTLTSLRVLDFMDLSSEVTVSFVVGDLFEPTLLEAGIDGFQVTEGNVLGITDQLRSSSNDIFPNPVKEGNDFRLKNNCEWVKVFNNNGVLVKMELNTRLISTKDISEGIYLVQSYNKGVVSIGKLLIIR